MPYEVMYGQYANGRAIVTYLKKFQSGLPSWIHIFGLPLDILFSEAHRRQDEDFRSRFSRSFAQNSKAERAFFERHGTRGNGHTQEFL